MKFMLNNFEESTELLKLFVAGSSDTREVAQYIYETHRLIKTETKVPFEVYLYEFDRIGEKGDISISDQKIIPHPVDSQNVGLICLFGEQFGTPINDYEIFLEDIEWATKPFCENGAHLVLDWTPEAAQCGGFALTGTAYEALTVIGRNRMLDVNDLRHVPLALMFCADDDSILYEENPIDGSWGWRSQYRARLEQVQNGQIKESEFDAWKDHTYKPQIQQLSNFVRFLTESNRFLRPERDIVTSPTDVIEKVKAFYHNDLDVIEHKKPHRFKGLSAFDIEDESVFFGRETEKLSAKRKLDALYLDDSRPNLFCIYGISGQGKSSFLRAGFIAPILNDTHYGVVINAQDFLSNSIQSEAPVHSGLASFLVQFQNAIPSAPKVDEEAIKLSLSDYRSEVLPVKIADMLTNLVDIYVAPPFRYVLAIDQMEIFSQSLDLEAEADRKYKDQTALAKLVLNVLRILAQHTKILIAFTAQEDTKMRLEQHDAFSGDLSNGESVRLLPMAATTLVDVAAELFDNVYVDGAQIAVKFDADLTRHLEVMIEELDNSVKDDVTSMLPLFSSMIQRLYYHILPEIKSVLAHVEDRTPDNIFDKAARLPNTLTIGLEQCEEILKLRDTISDLVNRAIEVVRTRVDLDLRSFDDHFEVLLKHLVEVRRFRFKEFQLQLKETTLSQEDGTFSAILDAFVDYRLLTPGSTLGSFRFGNIAVVQHWPFARDWMKRNRFVFSCREDMEQRLSDECNTESKRQQYFSSVSDQDVNRAATVLEAFKETWSPAYGIKANLAENEASLRNFCLEILRAFPHLANQNIEGAKDPKKPMSHLVADYLDSLLFASIFQSTPQALIIKDGKGRTLLYGLAFAGEYTMIDEFLCCVEEERRTDLLNARDNDSWQVIHAAAARGQVEAFKVLTIAGAVPNVAGASGQTALHLAVMSGNKNMVKVLLGKEYGFSPTQENDKNITPVHFAIMSNKTEIVELLFDSVTDDSRPRPNDPAVSNLLALAVENSAIQVGRWLLKNGLANVEQFNGDGRCPLHIAVEKGNLLAVDFLLHEAKADPNTKSKDASGATPLHLAVKGERLDIIEKLLSHDAIKVNLGDRYQATPLLRATEIQAEDVIAVLLKHPDIDVSAADHSGKSPLHIAHSRGDGTLILRLMRMPPANMNIKMGGGWTPLLLVSSYIGLDRLKSILDDPTVHFIDISETGKTLLDGIVKDNRHDLANWLENLMIDPRFSDAKDIWAKSLPQILAESPAKFRTIANTVKFDLNTPNLRGWTCLHVASALGDMELISLLRDRYNLDPNITDNWGRKAYDLVPRSLEIVSRRYLEQVEEHL